MAERTLHWASLRSSRKRHPVRHRFWYVRPVLWILNETLSDGTLVEDGYSESLSSLVEATNEAMAKYHVDEAPRIVASIAQRVSVKKTIESLIAYVVFGICLFPLL